MEEKEGEVEGGQASLFFFFKRVGRPQPAGMEEGKGGMAKAQESLPEPRRQAKSFLLPACLPGGGEVPCDGEACEEALQESFQSVPSLSQMGKRVS